MRDYRDEDHMEEWGRQKIDDMEFLIRQDIIANCDCTDCVYRDGNEICRNIESPYFGMVVTDRDVCDEIEVDDEED